jgi:predicted aconitase with swiveling domain
MSKTLILHGPAGFGAVVEGELLVSTDAFSPRYDLDRANGEISRKGHAIAGHNIAGKSLVVPAAKGGVAAGWAFYDLAQRGIAPQALICSNTNPVFVQGCVLAGISILHRLAPDPLNVLNTGDRVRVDPVHGTLEVLSP